MPGLAAGRGGLRLVLRLGLGCRFGRLRVALVVVVAVTTTGAQPWAAPPAS